MQLGAYIAFVYLELIYSYCWYTLLFNALIGKFVVIGGGGDGVDGVAR